MLGGNGVALPPVKKEKIVGGKGSLPPVIEEKIIPLPSKDDGKKAITNSVPFFIG